MKKTAALVLLSLLILSLLSSCKLIGGSGSSGDSGTGSGAGKSIKDVIPASALLSLEEASAVMGITMAPNKVDPFPRPFIDEVKYECDKFKLSVQLWQHALYDETSKMQTNVLKNGWPAYMERQRKSLADHVEEYELIELSGLGDYACLQPGVAFGQWLLHVFYGEYWFTIVIGNAGLDNTPDSEEMIAWKQDTLQQAAKVALKNLKVITG